MTRKFSHLLAFTSLLLACTENVPSTEQGKPSNYMDPRFIDLPKCELPVFKADKSILLLASGGVATDTVFLTDPKGPSGRRSEIEAQYFLIDIADVTDEFDLILYSASPVLYDIVDPKRKIKQVILYGAGYGDDYVAVKGMHDKSITHVKVVEPALVADSFPLPDYVVTEKKRTHARPACHPLFYFDVGIERHDFHDISDEELAEFKGTFGALLIDHFSAVGTGQAVSISQFSGDMFYKIIPKSKYSADFKEKYSSERLPASVYNYYEEERGIVREINVSEWISLRDLRKKSNFRGWERLELMADSGQAWLVGSQGFRDKISHLRKNFPQYVDRVDAFVIDDPNVPKDMNAKYIEGKNIFPTIVLLPDTDGNFHTRSSFVSSICFINAETGDTGFACQRDARN